MNKKAKEFLYRYLNNASPTGFEAEGQKIWLDYLKPYTDEHFTDAYGTAVTVINPKAKYKVVIEAHADEIAWFVNYISPDVSGVMPFNDNSFDLVTCFGVLHHIPNVSFVISEVFRVLKQGGTFLLREPIVSMGDWTKKRGNLTKNERGIPLPLFRDIINQNEFKIVNEQLCNAKPFDLIFSKIFGRQAYCVRSSLISRQH